MLKHNEFHPILRGSGGEVDRVLIGEFADWGWSSVQNSTQWTGQYFTDITDEHIASLSREEFSSTLEESELSISWNCAYFA